MDLTLNSLGTLALRTLTAPRVAADTLMSMRLPRNAIWIVLLIAAIIATLCATMIIQLVLSMVAEAEGTVDADVEIEGLFAGISPISLAIQTVFSLWLISFIQYWVGARLLNGSAALDDVILVNGWFQSISSIIMLLSFVILTAIPVLGGLPALLLMFYLFWIFLVFLDRAEGFGSILKALFQVIISAFAMIVISILISSLLAPFFGGPA